MMARSWGSPPKRSKLVLTALLLHLGCNSPPPQPVDPNATPPKQLTLHGVHVDEKRADGTVWHGTAKTSSGDLNVNELEDVDLTVTNPQQRSYVVHSPQGVFDFDKDVGTFEEARVTDESGGVVHGGRAHYNGPEKRIDADGPMKFATPDLRASAPRATFYLETGTVVLPGPVVGRFNAQH